MSTSTPTALEELRSRRSDLQKGIEDLISERDRLYNEFQSRMDGDSRPSQDEISRFEARRNHEDTNVRPTEDEVRSFESRLSSGPGDEEVRKFNTDHTGRRNAIRDQMHSLALLDEQIEEQLQLSHSREVAERASRGIDFRQIQSQRDALTYRTDNQADCSYFLDLAAMQNMEVRSTPDPRLEGFRERLDKHAREMADLLPQRWAARKAAAEARVEQAEGEFRARVGLSRGGFEVSPFERTIHNRAQPDELELRAPSRIVGQGGYAIPPLWLTPISHVAA